MLSKTMIIRYFLIALFIIIVIFQILRIAYVFTYDREGFHSDETFSYIFANSYYNPYIFSDSNGEIKNFNSWISGQVFRDYIEVNNNEQFEFGSVYYNQKNDMSPPLYSMLLHYVCSFFPNTFSWNYAFLINVIAFILTQVMLYKLGALLTLSKEGGVLTCIFYGFTTGALNTFIYLRMYSILTFFTVLFSYIHCRMFRKRFVQVNLDFIALIFVTIAGSMTHYYFYVFLFFLAVLFCIYFIYYKMIIVLFKYSFMILLSVCLSFEIYPYAIDNMLNGASAYNYQMPLYWNIRKCISTLTRETMGIGDIFSERATLLNTLYWFIAMILMLLTLCFLFRNEKWFFSIKNRIIHRIENVVHYLANSFRETQPMVYMLFTVAILTSLVIAKVSNIVAMGIYHDRYLFFLMPILCSVIISVFYSLSVILSKEKAKRSFVLFLVVFIILFTNNTFDKCNYIFPSNQRGLPVSELVKDANCIIITSFPGYLVYYSSLLHETNSFIAIRDTECMLFDDLLNETDTSKPVYAIIETKKFPNEDGTLPLFGSIKIIGGNLGLEYTKQDYLDHLAKLSWVSQVTFMSSQTGFTGPIEVYRLS